MLAEADHSPRTALPGKILVVDDEQRILRFVVRGLEAEGFAVDAADNGTDGLHKALEGGYDLIILDLLMPGMDGASVLRRLVAQRPAQAVLVLSCLTATATPARPRRRGAILGVVVAVAVGLAILALTVAALPVVLDLTACSAAEERVFAEFPHYGAIRLQPSGQADAGSCTATYRAPAPEEGVLAYYQRALRTRGWTLQPPQANVGSDAQGREFRSGELRARRGAYAYAVLYEGGPALQGGGTHVAVHVSKD